MFVAPLVTVVYETFNFPQCKIMELKYIQHLLEKVEICKRCWKTKCAGPGGFFFCLENIGLVYADVTMFTSKHMNIKHFVLRLSSFQNGAPDPQPTTFANKL